MTKVNKLDGNWLLLDSHLHMDENAMQTFYNDFRKGDSMCDYNVRWFEPIEGELAEQHEVIGEIIDMRWTTTKKLVVRIIMFPKSEEYYGINEEFFEDNKKKLFSYPINLFLTYEDT